MSRFELLMLGCLVLSLLHLLWIAWAASREFEHEAERNRLLREWVEQTGREP